MVDNDIWTNWGWDSPDGTVFQRIQTDDPCPYGDIATDGITLRWEDSQVKTIMLHVDPPVTFDIFGNYTTITSNGKVGVKNISNGSFYPVTSSDKVYYGFQWYYIVDVPYMSLVLTFEV